MPFSYKNVVIPSLLMALAAGGALAPLAVGAQESPTPPPATEPDSNSNWQVLFDGESLDGWTVPYDRGRAWVEAGEIRLEANRNFFLVSEQSYDDFVLEVEAKMPTEHSNSGIFFRAETKPNRLWGYQAEIDATERNWSGALYDSRPGNGKQRRGYLNPIQEDPASVAAFEQQAGDAYKPGEWNRYRIEAVGDRLKIYVNDVLTTDLTDDAATEGVFALQHHGEKDVVYRFRNLRVREIDR